MKLLSVEVLALRGALLWLISMAVLVGISGYTARPSRTGPVSLWLAAPIILAQIALAVASVCFSAIAALATRHLGKVPAQLFASAAFLASLWFSYVVVQFLQNAVYRRIGAPVQRVRWFTVGSARRERKRGGRQDPGQ